MTRKNKPKTLAADGLNWKQRTLRWFFSPVKLCIAAVAIMVWLLWPRVADQFPQLDVRPEYQITAANVQVTPPPRWIPEDLVEKVFLRASFDEPLSLLDPDVTEKIALAFHTHPWVERLEMVRKNYPARVTVDIVYREPVAMVEVLGDGYYPIDRHAHLLPHEDFSTADIDRYPVVTRVTVPPAGSVGDAWGDPTIAGAAELAAVLAKPNEAGHSWWTTLGLREILVPVANSEQHSTALSDPQYFLKTVGGAIIAWGRSPGTGHPGEITVSQKLQRMAEYHQRYNGFDSSPTPFLIDIRHWKDIRRSLLADSSEFLTAE